MRKKDTKIPNLVVVKKEVNAQRYEYVSNE